MARALITFLWACPLTPTSLRKPCGRTGNKATTTHFQWTHFYLPALFLCSTCKVCGLRHLALKASSTACSRGTAHWGRHADRHWTRGLDLVAGWFLQLQIVMWVSGLNKHAFPSPWLHSVGLNGKADGWLLVFLSFLGEGWKVRELFLGLKRHGVGGNSHVLYFCLTVLRERRKYRTVRPGSSLMWNFSLDSHPFTMGAEFNLHLSPFDVSLDFVQ